MPNDATGDYHGNSYLTMKSVRFNRDIVDKIDALRAELPDRPSFLVCVMRILHAALGSPALRQQVKARCGPASPRQ